MMVQNAKIEGGWVQDAKIIGRLAPEEAAMVVQQQAAYDQFRHQLTLRQRIKALFGKVL